MSSHLNVVPTKEDNNLRWMMRDARTGAECEHAL
jgi:hypothetical protein